MDESRLADGKTPALTQRPRRKKQFTRQALFFLCACHQRAKQFSPGWAGRDGVWLAQQGHRVTAMNSSAVSLVRL